MPSEKIEAKVVDSRFSLAIGKIEIHSRRCAGGGVHADLMAELPPDARPLANAILNTGEVTAREMLRALRCKALGWSGSSFSRRHMLLDYSFAAFLVMISLLHWSTSISALFVAQSVLHLAVAWGMLVVLAATTFAVFLVFVLPQQIAAQVVQVSKARFSEGAE